MWFFQPEFDSGNTQTSSNSAHESSQRLVVGGLERNPAVLGVASVAIVPARGCERPPCGRTGCWATGRSLEKVGEGRVPLITRLLISHDSTSFHFGFLVLFCSGLQLESTQHKVKLNVQRGQPCRRLDRDGRSLKRSDQHCACPFPLATHTTSHSRRCHCVSPASTLHTPFCFAVQLLRSANVRADNFQPTITHTLPLQIAAERAGPLQSALIKVCQTA